MPDSEELHRIFRFAMQQIRRYHWKKEIILYKYTAVLVGSPVDMPYLEHNNDNHPLWT